MSIENSNNGNKKPLFYLLVITIPLVIFLLSGEVIARFLISPQNIPNPPLPSIVDPYQPNLYMVQIRPYLYFHIPTTVYTQARADYQVAYEINTRGFRGPEIMVPKPSGLKRLLIIGDSIVEGHGSHFTKTFAYRLDENIRSAGWEVVNVGVQGASPIYYAANTDRYLSLQPDAVLIMTYENDIWEDRIREVSYFDLPYIDDVDRILTQSPTSNIMFASYFYLALNRLRQDFTSPPLEQIIARNREIIAMNQAHQTASLDPFLIEPSLIDQQWRMSQEYLDYAVASFQQNNVQVLVTNLSIKSIRPDVDSAYHDYAFNVDERVSTWAEEKQIPSFSLLPVIIQIFKEKEISEVIIEGDGHPTSNTHAIMETALRPWLLQKLNHQ
ncbi:SGNH/GDSL hydrolase family protein [Anaerolineales bacterium HSG25]|nr:SGNH/GDSL hydrolase family protein [Anaerolineales bacterium HSG25]